MSDETHRLRVPVSDEDWSRGPATAPVTLVEYLDFECEHCQATYPMLERLVRAYRDHVRFAVRHFPVIGSHLHAMDAALAAEAAGRQGRFWEMHERLFKEPGRLSPADLLRHARELKLDLGRFETDISDPQLRHKIEEQKRQGVRSGVNGTPTLFLNGVRYDGPRSYDALAEAIEAAAHEPKPQRR
jgi:protein-disulfide isomerase